MTCWTRIYGGMIGMRPVKIERGDVGVIRVITTSPGTDDEIEITGVTPGLLEEKLINYGVFKKAQAREVINKILFK